MKHIIDATWENCEKFNKTALSYLPDSVFKSNAELMLNLQLSTAKKITEAVTEAQETLAAQMFSVKPSTARK